MIRNLYIAGLSVIISIGLGSIAVLGQSSVSKVWIADNGDGTYTNPILHADYSDPDVVRVGDDYYMVSSSFNCVPGLPVLHSRDLVNWSLIGHALKRLAPDDFFDKPQHGNGVWAPCIRYYNNEFYIYYPDPDHGIYLVKSKNPEGPWSEPILVRAGKGLIDPSPLWDDDGKKYLTFAFAGSRAGIKSVILVAEMNSDGTKINGEEVMVFDGHNQHPTVEGPKFYKRNNYYYIFAPAGGVSTGWQLVLRSKFIYGPYEKKIVMHQGETDINGPHQGAWVTTPGGEDWFLHFQDKEAYGRVVHLQPMVWKNDWPVIGSDTDGDGTGEPVSSWKMPSVGKKYRVQTPPDSDEFDGHTLGSQWQWHGNPSGYWGFPTGNLGYYRLNCIPRPEGVEGLSGVPNLLLQKFPAEQFTATVKLVFLARNDEEEAGFVVMGNDYQFISLKRIKGQLTVMVRQSKNALAGGKEQELFAEEFTGDEVYFRLKVTKGAVCNFSFSTDGSQFKQAGPPFVASPGRWIGAKIGFFALREGITNDSGTVNIDWFRVE